MLPPDVNARVAVEQAATLGWDRYVGRLGSQIVMHTFGASAPLKALKTKFGFTPEHVYDEAKKQIERVKSSAPTARSKPSCRSASWDSDGWAATSGGG